MPARVRAVISGTRMIRRGSFYDTDMLEELLVDHFGQTPLIDLAEPHGAPRLFANSSLSNASPPTPFLFRSYNLPLHADSLYAGSCTEKTWQALRATTAAPRCGWSI